MTETSEAHDTYHAFGQYAHCPGCKAQRAEAEAERERAHDAEIDRLTCELTTLAAQACTYAGRLRATVDKMISPAVYDIEMAEGSAGPDALAELDKALLSLRHVERIAQWRRGLEIQAMREAEKG